MHTHTCPFDCFVSCRSLLTQLSASLLTGLMTTTVANPMDVVKTIMWVM